MAKISKRETEILIEALNLESDLERAKYISSQCREDGALRRRIQDALDLDDSKNANDDTLAATNLSFPDNETASLSTSVQEEPGVVIGPYRLLDVIGEGGMGSVWRAEQRSPVHREVAIKVIKLGMDTAEVIARFEVERQALAIMSHPNIAQVLDAGATEQGRPFFVMELVKGKSVTDFCDHEKLSTQERLTLFMSVCDAIQHAHTKGIIHRDLKPSNVLVSRQGKNPVAKVIDFGLAKATGHKLTEKTVFTAYGQVMGTPAYMSPEQADMSTQDIDTRTDVYSLGVMLYELLVGGTPFDFKKIGQEGFSQILRTIREVEPPPMCDCLSSATENSDQWAKNRSSSKSGLNQQLRGDLEIIVGKSLEKDRERRYQSPRELADDIHRFLNSEAIEARPASLLYRVKKMAQRNRGLFVATALILLALFAGLFGTAKGMIEAKRQTTVANENLIKSEKNYEFARSSVEKYFTLVSENRLLNEPHMDSLRKELLTSANEFYETLANERQNDPTARLDLGNAQLKLGQIAWRTGDLEKGIATLEAAHKALALPTTSPKLAQNVSLLKLRIQLRLSEYYFEFGRSAESSDMLGQAITDAKRVRKSSDSKEIRNVLARLYAVRGEFHSRQRQDESAFSDFKVVPELLSDLKVGDPDEFRGTPLLARNFFNHAKLCFYIKANEESEVLLEKSLTLRRDLRKLQPEDIETQIGVATVASFKGQLYRRLGRLDEAQALAEESVEIGRKMTEAHPELTILKTDLLSYLANLAIVHQVKKNFDHADELNDEVHKVLKNLIARYPKKLSHRLQLAGVEGNRGNTYLSTGRLKESIVWFERSTQTLLDLLERHPTEGRAKKTIRNNYWGCADAYVGLKDFEKAVQAFDKTIEFGDEQSLAEIRMAKAMAIAKSGDYELAIESVNNEMKLEDTQDIIRFDGARVLVLAMAEIQRDEAVEEPKREENFKTAAHQAIGLLEESLDGGFLKENDAKSPLLGDEFRSLRSLEKFQQLLKKAKLDLE